MDEDISIAVELGQIGFARASASLHLLSRRGRLSKWLPEVGESCCECAILFGMEDEIRALQTNGAETITLPGLHVPEIDDGLRANIMITWDAARRSYLLLTMADYGAGEIEALLTAERRNKQIADERLLVETERANLQTRINAVALERARIARDLHDTFVQSMVAVLTQIRLVQKVMPSSPEMALRELASAESVAREGLQSARQTLGKIRSRGSDAATLGVSVREALAKLRTRLDIRVSLVMDPDADDLRGEPAKGLARILEEALRNIERHARARSLDIVIRAEGDGKTHLIQLQISDDGIGFDTNVIPDGHFGLVGMSEQVKLLHGELGVESSPGGGTRVDVRIPLPEH